MLYTQKTDSSFVPSCRKTKPGLPYKIFVLDSLAFLQGIFFCMDSDTEYNMKTQPKNRFMEKLKREREETAILLRSIPAIVVSLFVVSVICMNLLANKTLVQTYWIALDGGILISWLAVLFLEKGLLCLKTTH